MKKLTSIFLSFILVSILFIHMGAQAEPSNEQVKAYLNKSISFKIDNKDWVPTTDGEAIYPISYNNTTYLPLRAISEALNVDVEWIGEHNKIKLNTTKLISNDHTKNILSSEFVHILVNGIEKPELLTKELLEDGDDDKITQWFLELEKWKMNIHDVLSPYAIDSQGKETLIEAFKQYYTYDYSKKVFKSLFYNKAGYYLTTDFDDYYNPTSLTNIQYTLNTSYNYKFVFNATTFAFNTATDVEIMYFVDEDHYLLSTTSYFFPNFYLSQDETKIILNTMERPELLTKELIESGDQEKIIQWFVDLYHWRLTLFSALQAYNIDEDGKDEIMNAFNQYYSEEHSAGIFDLFFNQVNDYYVTSSFDDYFNITTIQHEDSLQYELQRDPNFYTLTFNATLSSIGIDVKHTFIINDEDYLIE
ncbi:stalk domain-containing protein [Chengkuizengella axinellae]|uniref:Stalk domain-containing protein n=1 Tax=Chengkuizengella axinellae TaxID=3064388 RepID=A0ABT9J156_9BACL|nr:stalk domain-containing protein [Chengkuizengella sp. 2205SS18-9]MDP5275203.1 stalk domain-containing protein [Chengkuizengella sp. 2205SS18-9]